MKTWTEEMLKHNEAYVKTPEAGQFAKKMPFGDRVLICCMDIRCRPEAVGAGDDFADNVVRVMVNAGGKPEMRSILPRLYLFPYKEFALMTHTDCGLTQIAADPDRVIELMRQQLSPEQFTRAKGFIGEPIVEKLKQFMDTFTDPYEEVRYQVENLNHPLTPPDIIVHGLVQDIFTGKVEVVVNGYEA